MVPAQGRGGRAAARGRDWSVTRWPLPPPAAPAAAPHVAPAAAAAGAAAADLLRFQRPGKPPPPRQTWLRRHADCRRPPSRLPLPPGQEGDLDDWDVAEPLLPSISLSAVGMKIKHFWAAQQQYKGMRKPSIKARQWLQQYRSVEDGLRCCAARCGSSGPAWPRPSRQVSQPPRLPPCSPRSWFSIVPGSAAEQAAQLDVAALLNTALFSEQQLALYVRVVYASARDELKAGTAAGAPAWRCLLLAVAGFVGSISLPMTAAAGALAQRPRRHRLGRSVAC